MVCIFYSHRHHFLPKLEISDRIQLKIAFVFMIIQVKAIDTTSGVTATGGLHSNFFMGIANIDSLPTATMILSISLSLPCPISRSQVFTLQSYDKRKPASTTWRLFLIFCLSSRWLPKKNTEIPCIMFTRIYRICLHVKSLSPFNLRDLGRGNNIFKLLIAAGLSWVHTENEYSYDVTFCSWRLSSYSYYSLLSWKMERHNR